MRLRGWLSDMFSDIELASQVFLRFLNPQILRANAFLQ